MKNLKIFFIALLAATLILPLSAADKKGAKTGGQSIVVPSPTLMYAGADDAWLAAYVQGLLTTNIQNYSDMTVIDRMNMTKIMKEQKLAESMADMQSEEDQIKIGKIVSAKYTVAVQIIKKGSDYSLDIKVDDTEKGTSVGKAYTNPSCSDSDLKNGRAIYLASYDLLKGLGVSESQLKGLLTEADATAEKQTDSAKSNANVAKGIVAQKSGNVVEAMAYFNQVSGANIAEAAERLGQIEVSITTGLDDAEGGTFAEQVQNEIDRRLAEEKRKRELEAQWTKIWEQYAEYEINNWPVVIYSDLETGEIHYADTVENSTVDLNMHVAVGWNPECTKLFNKLVALEAKTGITVPPLKNIATRPLNYAYAFILLNGKYCIDYTLTDASENKLQGFNQKLDGDAFDNAFGEKYEIAKNSFQITFKDVPVTTVSEKTLNIKIEAKICGINVHAKYIEIPAKNLILEKAINLNDVKSVELVKVKEQVGNSLIDFIKIPAIYTDIDKIKNEPVSVAGHAFKHGDGIFCRFMPSQYITRNYEITLTPLNCETIASLIHDGYWSLKVDKKWCKLMAASSGDTTDKIVKKLKKNGEKWVWIDDKVFDRLLEDNGERKFKRATKEEFMTAVYYMHYHNMNVDFSIVFEKGSNTVYPGNKYIFLVKEN